MKALQNKKVTVMGLGLHGGNLAAVLWLLKQGAMVTVTDLKDKKRLADSIKQLPKSKNLKLVLGAHRDKDFVGADLIVQNPGVPRNSKYVILAKKNKIPIENEASIFFKNCPGKIIGVTGTRGKSTTSSIIYELLKTKYRHVWLAGQPQNPMMAILDRVKPGDLVVLELSSWQLEILGEHKLSPAIAVLTNIYPDHLNRYSSMSEYLKAKTNIYSRQTAGDYLIINNDIALFKKLEFPFGVKVYNFTHNPKLKGNGCLVRQNDLFFKEGSVIKKVADLKRLSLLGEHNRQNFSAAVCVAKILGVGNGQIVKTMTGLKGLPFRQELIRLLDGVSYYNDTTATTPDGTMAALKTLSKKNKKIILIAGGDTKNLPQIKYNELAKLIKRTCKAVILLNGRGSEMIIKGLKTEKYLPIFFGLTKMDQSIFLARSLAKNGDIILLSPACASFNLFVNEFDRGEIFNQIVKKM